MVSFPMCGMFSTVVTVYTWRPSTLFHMIHLMLKQLVHLNVAPHMNITFLQLHLLTFLLVLAASTWHSFPNGWDKSKFLQSLGVKPVEPRNVKPRDKSIPSSGQGKENIPNSFSAGNIARLALEVDDGAKPLWKSDETPIDRKQIPTQVTSVDDEERAAKEAKDAEQMAELVSIISALCEQQKETEAGLEEVTVVIGDLERRWRSEKREMEKERRRERRQYEENIKRRDADVMKIREELKRERCLREMAESRVKRAEEVAKAGMHTTIL